MTSFAGQDISELGNIFDPQNDTGMRTPQLVVFPAPSPHAANLTALLFILLVQETTAFVFRSTPPVRRSHLFAAPDSDVEDVLDLAAVVAERAARAAGLEILAGMGADVRKEKANFKDIVTEVDGRCQELIKAEIAAEFPDHDFLGEEDVPPGSAEAAAAIETSLASAEWCWICDPVDGTTNLAAGIPLVTTSIALVRNGVVELGVVFDPNRDELFLARRGQGYATLNGQRLTCARPAVSRMKDAVLCVGNPPEPSAFARNVEVIRRVGPKVRGLRMLSSAALIFCWVALGRVTAYVASDINAWDFAAGQLVVEETSSGATSDHFGGPLLLTTRDTVCSSGGVHDELLEVMCDATKGMTKGREDREG